ncbi:MFS transporter [Herbiconiux sp. VKM Ac-1786]|uniref:MFS transporter n=1 Tax=Herbiconiux sp. VKM Ac-1786 TaxID=2783824 RepID=UPI00188A30E1|nr:MFS transporter [Herbiconiux sp. VKM Ac-1786]MBF4572497.1 MFS transporter [Herbiconiux sp. VKM Ac-1786]
MPHLTGPGEDPIAPSAQRSATTTRHAPQRRRGRHSDTYGLTAMTSVLFLFFAAAAAPSPLLPLLLKEWGFQPWLLTFAFAVYALAILVALLVVGRLSDHIGRRPVILAATTLELASMIIFLVSENIWVFVIARTLQGLATGAATGAISAAIADFAGEHRARLTATLGSVGPLAGLAAGAVFAGTIAEFQPDPKPVIFAVLAVLFAIGLAGIAAVRESSSKRPGAARSLTPRVAVPRAARRAFWKAIPIAVAVWMAGGFYLSVVGETARDLLAITDELDTSLLIAGLSATGAVTVIISQRLRARTGATIGVLLIALGMLSGILAIQNGSVVLLIIGTVVSGAGFGMAFAGAVGLVIPHARAHERGELFSAIYVVNYLAFGIPAIGAGLFITPLGLSAAVLLYAAAVVAVAVIGVAVQALPNRDARRTQRHEPPSPVISPEKRPAP